MWPLANVRPISVGTTGSETSCDHCIVGPCTHVSNSTGNIRARVETSGIDVFPFLLSLTNSTPTRTQAKVFRPWQIPAVRTSAKSADYQEDQDIPSTFLRPHVSRGHDDVSGPPRGAPWTKWRGQAELDKRAASNRREQRAPQIPGPAYHRLPPALRRPQSFQVPNSPTLLRRKMHKPFGTFPTDEARGPGVFRPYFFFLAFFFRFSPFPSRTNSSGVRRLASGVQQPR
ncbi:hypothetical protein LZ32DRAFT_401375 [Colletotrichum eremochloae]|nr:hypothetical protein LZ32DRAFT_401375 [Colletotrichum eremochloae]